MRDKGDLPVLPVNPAPYLSDWLFEIGPTVAAGMGEGPIEYRDLVAWQEINGVELLPWEAKLLRRLSGEYLAQKQRSRKPDCPAPDTEGEDGQAVQDRVTGQFKAMLRALKPAPGRDSKAG